MRGRVELDAGMKANSLSFSLLKWMKGRYSLLFSSNFPNPFLSSSLLIFHPSFLPSFFPSFLLSFLPFCSALLCSALLFYPPSFLLCSALLCCSTLLPFCSALLCSALLFSNLF